MSETLDLPAPTRWLNYPGDLSDRSGFIVGPDTFGGLWRAVEVTYDPEADKTRVGFVPFRFTEKGMAV